MMAINRYRLKHLVKERHKGARRVSKLLQRTDKLLGVILVGNNFVNILASVIATVIAIRLWGDGGIFPVTIIMTIVILIFAEVTPKTIAALKPESVAFPAAVVLKPLANLLKPVISGINLISNSITKILGVNPESEADDNLKPEELKTLLQTSGMPEKQQKMLMGIFDMDFLSVNDVMVPRNEIVGIDLDDPLELILKNLQETDFTYTPFYKDSIDNIVGFLTVNRKSDFFSDESIDLEHLLSKLEEPIFIPENTSLNRQLANFQTVDTRVGLIVDEYGDIEGLITLRDILEVIVGEITSGAIEKMDIMPQTDGSFMIEGNVMIREINSRINWDLPTEGPKTLSGLILETVQSIPETNVGISIGGYRFETILIKDNVVKIAKAEKIEIDFDDEELDKE